MYADDIKRDAEFYQLRVFRLKVFFSSRHRAHICISCEDSPAKTHKCLLILHWSHVEFLFQTQTQSCFRRCLVSLRDPTFRDSLWCACTQLEIYFMFLAKLSAFENDIMKHNVFGGLEEAKKKIKKCTVAHLQLLSFSNGEARSQTPSTKVFQVTSF